ncbi:hypothetical protein K8I31_13875, partial [bacterium]|nr:hypothetical protein [bacterium]
MLKPQGVMLRLTYIFLLFVLILTPVYSQNEANTLTVQDVEEAKRLILSDQVALKSRIDLAKRLSILFEQIDKPEIARRLTLDFISSASSL